MTHRVQCEFFSGRGSSLPDAFEIAVIFCSILFLPSFLLKGTFKVASFWSICLSEFPVRMSRAVPPCEFAGGKTEYFLESFFPSCFYASLSPFAPIFALSFPLRTKIVLLRSFVTPWRHFLPDTVRFSR